jgi:uncharacterized protein YjaZ
MNNIHLHIMEASGKLEPFLEIIDDVQKKYLPDICDKLGASDVDIIICDDPSRAIPETGVGGWAFHAHLLTVYIDPQSNDLVKRMATELKSTLAHELNHVTRWRRLGYKETLLESIISDGLADHFDIAINGGSPRPWDIALSNDDCEKYLALAKSVWNDGQYDHPRWYFGTSDIPRWTGYSLGYKLVGDYIAKSGIKEAKTLVGLPAEEFIK